MSYPGEYNNQRQSPRYSLQFPVQIIIGSQITLSGQLKDLSLKSAFIKLKNSIYMQPNDEMNFVIQCSASDAENVIKGTARISRMVPGEGIAIYFIEMDKDSTARLKDLVK